MAAIKDSAGDRVFNAVNLVLVSLIMLIVLIPLIYILSSSISDPDLVSTGKVFLIPRGVTLDGYRRVLQDPEIMLGYRNTIFYTVAGTLINLLLTLTAAYALSKQRFMGRRMIMMLMVFTMYFGGGMIPTYLLMRDLHLINTVWVLLLAGAISTHNLIVSRTFFSNGVPQDLEEAAMIDGCSTIRIFVRIVLPLSKALIGVMALYYAVGHWNSYFSALIYLTDRDKVTLQLVLREILISNQTKAEMMVSRGGDEEMLIAQVKLASLIKYSVIVVSSLPVMVFYPFIQKYFDKGVMLGSIKG